MEEKAMERRRSPEEPTPQFLAKLPFNGVNMVDVMVAHLLVRICDDDGAIWLQKCAATISFLFLLFAHLFVFPLPPLWNPLLVCLVGGIWWDGMGWDHPILFFRVSKEEQEEEAVPADPTPIPRQAPLAFGIWSDRSSSACLQLGGLRVFDYQTAPYDESIEIISARRFIDPTDSCSGMHKPTCKTAEQKLCSVMHVYHYTMHVASALQRGCRIDNERGREQHRWRRQSLSPKPVLSWRGNDSGVKDGSLLDDHIYPIDVSGGTNADLEIFNMVIIDSGSPIHLTGDISLFADYTEYPATHNKYVQGAGGAKMRVHGSGSIHNEMFQVKDVQYVPSLNNPHIKKTIISVHMLAELDYGVEFLGDCCVVKDRRATWSWSHQVVGKAYLRRSQYLLDYLRIPDDRAFVPGAEEPALVASLWKAWTSLTRLLSRAPQRLPQ